MAKLQVSLNDLKRHFFRFFPSLKHYSEKYLHLIFTDTSTFPQHMAYVCPMCLKNFIFYTPSQLKWSEAFSLDHFPPEDVNGKLTVLVCKTCNNKAGSEYESKLSEIIEKECFNKKIPKSTVKASVTISDIRGWHKGKFSIDEDGQYKFDLTTNQTKNLPELAQWENEVVGDWEMKVTIKHADATKLVKALIKTVYLYCFNHWGYSFIFFNSGHLMRQVLSEQKSYPIKIPSILLDFKSDKFNSKIEGFHTGVVFISEPKTVQSIFVNIPIELKHLSYKCLIPIQIPNPTDQSIEEMQRINKLLLKEKSISVKLAPIDFPDPYMQNSFSYSWNYLLSKFN